MKRADIQTPIERDNKETRLLAELDGLSAEATRLLPLQEEPQAGQVSLAEGVAALPGDALISPPASGVASAGRRLAINTLIVGGAYVLSRVLGLLREIVIARQFGTTHITDDYVRAFRVPDTLFLLIIGGAVGSAFIPVFTRLLSKRRQDDAWRLASTLINASVVLLSLGGIVLGLLAPALVGTLIAPDQSPQDQAVVVELTRIMLLSPLFMGLGGWAMGVLNAQQRFTLPALAPIAYNVAIIAGALLSSLFNRDIRVVAWGVVVGALLHFGVQVPGLWRAGMRYSLRLNVRDVGVAEVGKLILPRILGQAAFQANIVGATFIASFLPDGHLAAFNYAYMLMILPHGVFAMSIATTTFPTMAAQFAESNLAGVLSTLARGLRVLLFLILPAAVGLFMLRADIVSALLQSGAFGANSTGWVASALAYFALGLTAYAVVEVLTRGFYALHDTRTPVIVSVSTVVINLALSAALVFALGWRAEGQEALAFSLALTTTVEMALLWVLLKRRLPGWSLNAGGMLPAFLKSLVAALAMGAVLLLVVPVVENAVGNPTSGKLAAIVDTGVGVLVGAVVYVGASVLLRSEELGEALRLVLRRGRNVKRSSET